MKDLYDIVVDITNRVHRWIFHVDVLVYNNDLGKALEQARAYQQKRLKQFIVRSGLLICLAILAYNLIK
jgi:hypothetical protein